VPELNPRNDCAYFKSQLEVFGHDLDYELIEMTLAAVRDALPESLRLAAQHGAVGLTVVDDLTRQVAGPGVQHQSPFGSGYSLASKIGMMICAMVTLIGFGVLGVYVMSDYRSSRFCLNSRKSQERQQTSTGIHKVHRQDDRTEEQSYSDTSSRRSPPALKIPKKQPDVVVLFGPSFDPERDRYNHENEMEEESSAPPSSYQLRIV
jgi:hypothetical protein